MIIIDFSDPDSPFEVGRLSPLGQPYYVVAKYPYVVMVGSDALLRIVDVSHPTSPSVVDSYNTGGSYRLAVEGSTIATLTGYHGSLLLLDAPILNVTTPVQHQHPGHVTLTAYPNPFNPDVTMAFSTPSTQTVVLDIFDSAGRSVRTLVQEEFPTGTHRVTWDGRDSLGNRCASGVYFARMRAGAEMLNRKLVLLK